MVTEIKLIARSINGQTQTFQYKPGDKHVAQSKTIYKLMVDGHENLPPGTKIVRSGDNVLVQFPDGLSFELTNWCGISDSKLIDVEGSEALAANSNYVPVKEIESGECMIAAIGGEQAGALGETGAGAAAPGGGMSPGMIGGMIGGALLAGIGAGGGGGGGSGGGGSSGVSSPGKPATSSGHLATSSDTGTQGDVRTSDSTPTLTGTGTPGQQIEATFSDGEKKTITVQPDGTWSITPDHPLPNGDNTISIVVIDPSNGQRSDTSSTIIKIVPAAPALPDMSASTDHGSSASDNLTNDATPDFSAPPGSATPGQTVTLFVDGVAAGTAIVNPDGSHTITPASPIADGSHTISFTYQDAAGNESDPSPGLPIEIDTLAPSAGPSAAPDMTAASDTGSSSSDNFTNNNQPSFIVATPLVGLTLVLLVDGVQVAATFDALNNLLTPTNPIPDGAHTITTAVSDAAGNLSAQSPSLSINIDATAPSAPTISAIPENSAGGINASEASDGTTIQVAIPVNATAGDILTLHVGSQNITYTVVGGDAGTTVNVPISAPILAALSDGNITVTATLTDAANNTSASSVPFVFALDRVVPNAPTALDLITASDSGTNTTDNLTSDTTPTITGAPVESGATVTLYDSDGTTVIGTSVADRSGNWSITGSALSDGVHNITAQQTDAAGNQGAASAVLSVTVDTSAPATPGAPDMTAATDTGASNNDSNTSDTTPSFAIAAPAPGETPSLYVDGVKVAATFDALNNLLTPTNPISGAAHIITTTVSDAAGNESAQSVALPIVVDSSVPVTPGTAPDMTAATDSGINNDNISNDTTPSFAIAAPASGETPSLYVDGVKVAATFDSLNNILTPSTPLSGGAHSITSTVNDGAGNESAQSPALSISIDSSAPSAPNITAVSENDNGGINATEAGDGTTVDVAIPLDAEVGDILTVNIGGQLVSYTVAVLDIGGTASVPIAKATLDLLSDGANSITAMLTDAAGNASGPSASFGITLDRGVPATPAKADLSDLTDTGSSNIDDVTGINQPSFEITAPGIGETPLLYVDGVNVAATLSQNPFISSIYYLTPLDQIADGAHDITYTFSDAVGNESSPSLALSITVDTTPPSDPVLAPDLAPSSDSGLLDNDDYTNEVLPEFTAPAGTAAPGERVELFVDGVAVATGIVAADGSFNISPGTSMPDGVHDVAYRFIDAAGNESGQSAGLSVTIDTTAVAAPTILALAENSLGGVTAVEQASGGGTPVDIAIPGDANAGDVVILVIGAGPNQQTVSHTLLADGPTSITLLIPEAALTTLGNGTHSIVATITDQAGNISAPSAPFSLTLTDFASTAPTITSVADNDNGGINASEASDGIVVNVDLTGVQTSAGPLNPFGGDVLRLTINGENVDTVLSAADVTNGVIAVNIPNLPTLNALADGAYGITAVIFDGAPGTGQGADNIADPVSTSFNVTFDRSVTAATFTLDMTSASDTGTLATDNYTSNTTPDFVVAAGAGTPGDIVTLLIDGIATDTGAVLPDGSFAITLNSPIADGIHSAQYTFTDAAGNVSSPSPILNFTIDTTAPSTPSSAPDMRMDTDSGVDHGDDITNIAQPIFNIAAANPGESATIYVDGIAVPFAPLGGNNFQLTSPLADGDHVVTYTLTDAAGNESDVSPALNVTIDTTAPSAPSISAVPENSGGGINATEDDDGTSIAIDIPADANVGDVLTIDIGGQMVTYGISAPDVGATVSITIPKSALDLLSDGSVSINATLTDQAGNISAPSASFNITLDRGVPVAPAAAPDMTAATDSGINNDNISNDTTPSFAIAAPASGETPSLYVDGVKVAATFDSLNNILTPSTPLSGGAHSITSTVNDGAGNESAQSPALSISIDSSAPSAPTALDLSTASDSGTNSADNLTNDTTPTITGALVEQGATVTLYDSDGTTVLGTTIADSSGNWSITPSAALSAGQHNFTVTQTDVAGNLGFASSALAVTIDTSGPSFSNPPAVNEGFASFTLNSTTLAGSDNITASAGLEVVSAVFKSSSTFVAGDLNFAAPSGGAINVTRNSGASDKTGTVAITLEMRDAAGNITAQDVTLTINGINDAPSGTNKTITASEDTHYVFSQADFGFSDSVDSPANNFQSITVGGLTAVGPSGTAQQFISGAGATNHWYEFVSGTVSWTAAQDAATARGGHLATISDANENAFVSALTGYSAVAGDFSKQAPIGLFQAIGGLEGSANPGASGGWTWLDGTTLGYTGWAPITPEPNNAAPGQSFAAIISAGQWNDIALAPSSVTGYLVEWDNVALPGLYVNGVHATNGTTVTASDIAAGSVEWRNGSNVSGNNRGSFTFAVTDDGGTANGGADTDLSPNTITVNATAVNDAPVLYNNATLSISTPEYVFSGSGDAVVHAPSGASPTGSVLVSTLVANGSAGTQLNVLDADAGALVGIGVSALSNHAGATLWYTTNGSSTWNWTTNTSDSAGGKGLFGSDGIAGTADDRVLLLDPTAKIVFDGGNSSQSTSLSDAITLHAWDQTSGSNGGFVANPSTGGSSSLSSAIDTVQANFTATGALAANSIDLTRLDSAAGTRISGATAGAKLGWDVTGAGDVNGDGFDDFLIAENGVASTGKGEAFLFYGQAGSYGSVGADGVRNISTGAANLTYTRANNGETMEIVSNLGDINNDGYADILIAGRSSGNSGRDGSAYVLFGGTGMTAPASLDGAMTGKGFAITNGSDSGLGYNPDSAGWVGDVNGDGYNDLILGSRFAQTQNTSNPDAGSMTVVYGHSGTTFGSGTNAILSTASFANNVTDLNGTDSAPGTGIVIDATANTKGFGLVHNVSDGGNLGQVASGLGDLNGDGYADWGVGRTINSVNNIIVGFGKVTTDVAGNVLTVSSTLNGESLASTGTSAIRWDVGQPATATSTTALRGVVNLGDVDGDGLDDAAFLYTDATSNTGQVHVVKGSSSTDADGVTVSSMPGLIMTITGAASGDLLGQSVKAMGDINGDGFDDFAVGAPNNETNAGTATNQGGAYIIYGQASPSSTLSLGTALTSAQGLYIRGDFTADQAGFSVSGAGDVNGDGLDDLLIGAPLNDHGGSDAGSAYLLYGAATYGNKVTESVTTFNALGNTGSVQLVLGTSGVDTMTSGIGAGDAVSTGAGNDVIMVTSNDFQRVDGGTGTDTLRLSGNFTLDFTLIGGAGGNLSGKVRSIEQVDLGTGTQTLKINAQDVLNMSETSNALRITGTAGDTVDLSEVIGSAASQWHNMGTTSGVTTYQYFDSSNAATLAQVLIDSAITTS